VENQEELEANDAVSASSKREEKQKDFWHGVKSKIWSWFAWGKKKESETDVKVLAKQKAQERKEKNMIKKRLLKNRNLPVKKRC